MKKYDPKDITVVTGFYDIGRGDWDTQYKRPTQDYFNCFTVLAELKNPMVIVTSRDFAERIINIRAKFGLSDMTNVIIKDLPDDQRKRVQLVVANPIFRNYIIDKDIPEFRNSDYSLVTNQKSQFVVDAINSGFVQTDQVAWLDFGYCRSPKWFNIEKPWQYDFGAKINLWTMRPLDDKPIFDVVRNGTIFFMGGHMVGPTKLWHLFNDEWRKSFNSLIECGFADDDQTSMLMVWRKHPELFNVRPFVDRGHGSWSFILKDFNDNHLTQPILPVKPAALPPSPPQSVIPQTTFNVSVLKF